MNSFAANPENLTLLGLGLAGFLILLNLGTFAAFAVDKQRAMAGEWRVSEITLLSLAALGGWPAAKLAQWVLRHKTTKEPFRTMLNMVVLPLVAILGLVAYEEVDFPAVWGVINDQLAAQISTPAPAEPAAVTVTAAVATAATGAKPDSKGLPLRFGPGASAKNAGAWKSK